MFLVAFPAVASVVSVMQLLHPSSPPRRRLVLLDRSVRSSPSSTCLTSMRVLRLAMLRPRFLSSRQKCLTAIL